MQLKKIEILQFKSYSEASFDFDAPVCAFVGDNGVGKTNILEAIYYLCMTKGYFQGLDTHLVKKNCAFFALTGYFHSQTNEEVEKITCAYQQGAKKTFKHNGKAYNTLSEHIGKFPVVVISPYDVELLESSDMRRKFLDATLAQCDPQYLLSVVRYKKVLEERNTLLKQFAQQNYFDGETLQIYSEQLAQYGMDIYQKRSAFIDFFVPLFDKAYQRVSAKNETVRLCLESDMQQGDLSDLLAEHLLRDRQRTYTSVGAHRDDLGFYMQDLPIKKMGSQGQQKSFLIALKLAQAAFLKHHTHKSPILLLDDVFDKLDSKRVGNLLHLVTTPNMMKQVFITHTGAADLKDLVPKHNLQTIVL